MHVTIHGFSGKKHVAQVAGNLDYDELMDVVVSPRAYLNAVHPQARERKIDRAFAVIDCQTDQRAA